MITKPFLFAIASALMVATSVSPGAALSKEKKPKLVSYKKDSGIGLGAFGGKLLHSYGYKSKRLESGNWPITGAAKSKDPEHSQYIAIYRAAELASEREMPYIRIVSVNGKQLNAVFAGSTLSGETFGGGSISYGTRYVMEVEFSHEPDSEAHCADDVLRRECRSIAVEAATNEIRPLLKIKKKR